MNTEQAHKQVAQVMGEMSLAAVKGKASREVVRSWIVRLREVADALERRLGGST